MSGPAAPLRDDEDAFGRLLYDHVAGGAGTPLLERDDGEGGPALGAEWFFRPYDAWPDPERRVFDLVGGRVLDIGCGAGRHSLAAQERDLPAVAIDVSPGAVRVSSARGVRDARLLPLAQLETIAGPFDTVLMMCGNFGLPGDAEAAVRTLRTLRRMTSDGARVVLDTVDPYQAVDAADLAYQAANVAAGRMAGQVTIRIRYGARVTPWFDLLTVSAPELADLALAGGWEVETLHVDAPPDIYATLVKR